MGCMSQQDWIRHQRRCSLQFKFCRTRLLPAKITSGIPRTSSTLSQKIWTSKRTLSVEEQRKLDLIVRQSFWTTAACLFCVCSHFFCFCVSARKTYRLRWLVEHEQVTAARRPPVGDQEEKEQGGSVLTEQIVGCFWNCLSSCHAQVVPPSWDLPL